MTVRNKIDHIEAVTKCLRGSLGPVLRWPGALSEVGSTYPPWGAGQVMLRAYLGVLALLFIAWLGSENRRAIRRRTAVGVLSLTCAAPHVLSCCPAPNPSLIL